MEHNRNDNNQLETSYVRLEKEMQSDGYLFSFDGNESITQYSSQINQLQVEKKQLQHDLQKEQDVVIQLKRRLNNAEKEKLETAGRTNEEIASLETQLAKVRSQIEKGEAIRQNLEYELTKSQREVEHVRQKWKDKENALVSGTEDLKGKINDLSEEVRKLQHSLKMCTSNAEEHEKQLGESLEQTNKELKQTKVDLQSTLHERDKVNKLCQQHSKVISELNGKLQEFEEEKKNVLESLRRASAELQYAQEREERLKSDHESARSRIKTLEENIEAERASHLETKFNSEIVQLRVRDLDGAVDVEKSANAEAHKTIERLTLQNRELEQVYDEERKIRKELNQKFDKMERESGSAKKQLSKEIEDKKTVIGSLSKELEVHQKNFNELKSELSKAKKRQQYLEDTYGGSIKELEFLIQTFQFEDKKLRAARKDSSSADKGKKVSNPSLIVESFKQMLVQVKRRLDTQAEESTKSKKALDRLTKELESHKEMVKAKDKTLEDLQAKYTKAAKDLNKSRSSYSELESTIGKLKTSLQVNATNQDKDRSRIQELSEEIMKLVKRHRVEEEERVAFLHGIYQRLLSSHLIPSIKDKAFNQFAWADLTEVVYEQVSSLVDLLQSSDDKIKMINKTAKDSQETVRALKQEHAEQISRLTNSSQEREATWMQQKEQMEQHYTQMLEEVQSRSTKTQTIADQAWEQVRATGSIQVGLEAEVVQLRKELAESQVQASSLLTACALLSGALYPLLSRTSLLSSQRHQLEELCVTWENCRDRALYLNSVLNTSGRDGDQDRPERDRRTYRTGSPILTFRAAVIAVMAANRLSYLGQTSAWHFEAYSHTSPIGDRNVTVCVGSPTRSFVPVSFGIDNVKEENAQEDSASDCQRRLFSWLKCSDLLEAVIGSMTEVQEAIQHNHEADSPGESRALVSAARSSFTKFIERLEQFFPSPTLSPSSFIRDRSSLLRKLDKRLSKILSNTSPNMRGTRISSQDLMGSLQNHILDLTQRLHSAEKERRQLLTDLNDIKRQVGEGGHSEEEKNSEKGTKYVPISKFEKVCVELSSALRREQKAQMLLQEQSNQLMELTSRLDICTSDGMQKDHNLVQVQEGLTESQNELRHKEQALRQMSKQLSQVEFERDSVETNLKDAENALCTAARDKEILAEYTRNVEGALEKAKRQFIILKEPGAKNTDISLSSLLLDANLIPQDIGRAGPELISVQKLVGSFVDAHHQVINKVRSLDEEIASHREHIDILKSELSRAMHREFNEQAEMATDGAFKPLADCDSPEMFFPLKEDPDSALDASGHKFGTKTLHSPPVYQSKRSAFHSVKSNFHQSPPKKSPRPK